MSAKSALRAWAGPALTIVLLACESSTPSPAPSSSSPSPSPSSPPGDDAGESDASGDAGFVDARPPDCTLADADRDDAGFAIMTVDRSKLGEVCYTLPDGVRKGCPQGQGCYSYRLPEDPPSTWRCGPGCEAVTCPGEYQCVTDFSGTPAVSCDCF